MNRPAFTSYPISRHVAGQAPASGDDALAIEEPLEIRVEGRSVAVTMRTPGHDEELAAGFLLTEGVITHAGDVLEISQCAATTDQTGNIVDVLLRRPGTVDFAQLTRHVFSASSCGLCGKATLEAIERRFPALDGSATPNRAMLLGLPEQLQTQQPAFSQTGGLHAAALFDDVGHLLVVREDVGRHNAVDKVLGHVLLRRDRSAPSAATGLLVSGRISFEIVQKALAARLSLIAGVSAPTSLAVDLARRSGQTLVGFLRPGRLNVYTGHVAS